MDLIELVPDQVMIIKIEPAGKSDLRADRRIACVSAQRFAARKLRLSIISEFMAMADHRSGTRPPARSGLPLTVLGGLVVHQLEGVAAFDDGLTLRRETLEFNGRPGNAAPMKESNWQACRYSGTP